MYDPNQHLDELEQYLVEHLGTRVNLVQAVALTQSTRAAPWRLDVQVDGVFRSYLLQLDPLNMALEYRVLKALEGNPLPTPRVYGLDLLGQALGRPCFFSDPIYEFLLSFFAAPELQGRGIEERYCRRIGYDPVILNWYHGLEYFDTWRWVLVTGEPFVHHNAESLQRDLRRWLDYGR